VMENGIPVSYDEIFDARGSPRRHYRTLIRSLRDLPP
jgi:hypothetical protein